MGIEIDREVGRAIVDRFIERTPASRAADERAKGLLPGGDSRTSTYFAPYPAYMECGEGCRVYDLDGNEYLDCLNNYTSLIHGHAHPPTVEAIRNQATRGTVLGSASRLAVEHAAMLAERVPSLEVVRYCNSGTEATLMAVRAARAFTGKDGIVKMDGGYHGSADVFQVGMDHATDALGEPRLTQPGVPQSVLADALAVPYNDLAALERVLAERGSNIAAVILEAVMGSAGVIDPLPGYLAGVRELTERYSVLLILDEVMSFRLGYGGVQGIHGVRPDLTALGKIIGGGLPIGAFGGRRDIMAAFDPLHSKAITHSGTFNANNITMAAGLATMADYGAEAVERLNGLGQRVKLGFNASLQAAGVTAQATGDGSLVNIHWQMAPVHNAQAAAAAKTAAGAVPRLLHLELLNQGVFCASRLLFAVSTAMTERDIDQAVVAFERAVSVVKPFIADVTPHLLVREAKES